VAQDFKLPDLGENISGGDVVRVMVNEGDTIQPNQPVIEIETDKAVLEVPSPQGGRVTKVYVKQGQKAKVGSPLIAIEGNGAAGAPAAQKPAQPAAAPTADKPSQPAKEEAPRDNGPAASEKARPDAKRAAAEEPPASKATPAPATRKPPAASPAPVETAGSRPASKVAAPKATPEEDVPAGPATRRLARELGVELADVARKYPGQRLSEENVKDYVRERSARREDAAGAVAAPELPDFSQWGSVDRVPFSSLQRKTAEHLSVSWRLCPHVTQFDSADVTALESLRKRYRERGPAKDVKLTVTAFVLKAVAAALKQFPQFNATLDVEKEELILKRYYHIGVAVDTEAGLIVPVIHDVDRKRVLDLAAELEEVADRTRHRKMKSAELRGGTFTITNLGGIGGTGFTPIINYPEVAILGLSRAKQEVFLDGEEIGTRTMLPLSLSYDHRVVNGADGARFTRKLAELLEDPEMLLLQ
jgi:pyruvate dehydrogenase E2 component (dihydrolipoamide acetyltransferase)